MWCMKSIATAASWSKDDHEEKKKNRNGNQLEIEINRDGVNCKVEQQNNWRMVILAKPWTDLCLPLASEQRIR